MRLWVFSPPFINNWLRGDQVSAWPNSRPVKRLPERFDLLGQAIKGGVGRANNPRSVKKEQLGHDADPVGDSPTAAIG